MSKRTSFLFFCARASEERNKEAGSQMQSTGAG